MMAVRMTGSSVAADHGAPSSEPMRMAPLLTPGTPSATDTPFIELLHDAADSGHSEVERSDGAHVVGVCVS
jgi:hypothetical protein